MKLTNINSFKYSLLLITMVVLASCTKYLDEPPSKSIGVQVTTTQNLDALLDNYNTMSVEGGGSVRMFATDDLGFDKDLITNAAIFYNQVSPIYYATWDRTFMDNGSNSDWAFLWGRIFTANLVLTSLPKVSGTEQDKARLKAEAYFIRAYNYWVLANTYCLPYTTANREAPGLPLKLTSSFDEDVTRAPLYKVYEQIEQDLKEALKTTQPLVDGGIQRCWRANTAAVNAFAARYYLNLGNYIEAERYATLSLNSYSTLVDYNTEMGYSPVFANFPITYGTVDITWKEFTYYRVSRHGGLIVPSDNLRNIYDQTNDWRYVYHFVEGGGAIFGSPNVPVNYAVFGFFDIPSGPTVAETLLTKAESLARLNRVPEAITAVNLLRVKRMKTTAGTAVVNLTANNGAEAVSKILEERRREMPFSMRWFDLRRLNHNEDQTDNKTLTREFYQYNAVGILPALPLVTYILAPGSRKYAVMIPKTETISSQGTIVQNTY